MSVVNDRDLGTAAYWLGELQDNNPHDLRTKAGQDWLSGWLKGEAQREEMEGRS